MTTDRASVETWVADYLAAWRTEGTERLADLFTPDATYSPSPWAAPLHGLPEIEPWWEAERDGPDEAFTFTHEVVALDGDTAVLRVDVAYTHSRWRDLWVVTFTPDGRAEFFEEWPFAPDQPDGHG
ncbi:hypothetical protein N802_06040 [Knoellia sinensis KCTC 19936]|uniref:SnoaL-like domain-containing protein n=1 Tax=Knoellia sinensis KCTC 19936 TaxID=1385520 RepID=A0A0A0IZY9_9MICO|nr:nuclear transport factor 2 family protein [Knoellia sinensis]KGN30765.1 hypothetical protein N802_06040 [Knoellia sinensis KCTC 19936]